MKAWQIILLIVIIIGAVFLLMSFTKKKPQQPIVSYNRKITSVNPDEILHLGDEGEIVRLLQQATNIKLDQFNLSSYKVQESGYFGQETETAISQLTQGLLSSGKNNITVNNIRLRSNW